MDLITQLPKTGREHDAVMMFVDKLSKYVLRTTYYVLRTTYYVLRTTYYEHVYVRFAPTHTHVTSTGAVFLFLDKVVSLIGLPKKLITDREVHRSHVSSAEWTYRGRHHRHAHTQSLTCSFCQSGFCTK